MGNRDEWDREGEGKGHPEENDERLKHLLLCQQKHTHTITGHQAAPSGHNGLLLLADTTRGRGEPQQVPAGFSFINKANEL